MDFYPNLDEGQYRIRYITYKYEGIALLANCQNAPLAERYRRC